MENFRLDKQHLSLKALYNEIEISHNNKLIHKVRGISIIPIHVTIEPLKIKDNLVCKSLDVERELFTGIYYTNIIDYTLGEITFAANFLTDDWVADIWNLLVEEKENFLSITLTDETIKEHLLKENSELFQAIDEVDFFCERYNLKIENFVVAAKFEQIEVDLEGISARLSSEIIFFRKKIFTELLIQRLDAKIFEYEEVKKNLLPKSKKEIFQKWRTKQLREIELVQKYIRSPFTFDDLEQFTNFRSVNEFAISNYNQQDLVSETFYWIGHFPKAKTRFEIAIKHYQNKENYRDSIDNLRLALELLLKDLFKNSKSLDNQIPEIGKYQKDLGISKEIRNTFQKTLEYYNDYQNEHVKHDDSVANEHEVEFMFGLTMLLIRMLVKPNPMFNIQ
ncbi:hypothetical protein [Flavobacterium sp. CSZ]|uniref:hypothetical protein n=1 Tax=Flavobacterium sp. CSZ TaxID=2783791 RepID=UPI00188CFF42|nr:hypothetical protein [Flavobacterium sp. CSZ]MBF4485772.1 hypothetical protein [Flavobacterium sp. CSZ]